MMSFCLVIMLHSSYQCHVFVFSQSLVSICDLRASPDFHFKSDVDTAFGAAVGSMGVRYVGHFSISLLYLRTTLQFISVTLLSIRQALSINLVLIMRLN